MHHVLFQNISHNYDKKQEGAKKKDWGYKNEKKLYKI